MIFLPLPDASSPTIQLAHPTPAQKHVQTLKNSAIWRGALSQEAYLRREEHLANQTLTINSGITHWILVDTAEPEELRRVLCGCESIRKRAIVVQGGKTKDTISHCISNTKGPTMENLFSTLWSDIGKTFYAQHGWEAFPSSHICIPPASAASSTLVSSDLPKAKSLYASDLESLCVADEKGLRRALSTRPAASPPAISLLPDFQTISWHHARENFIGIELHGTAPKVKSALIPGPPGQRAWCYWTHMWYNSNREFSKGNTLHILRLAVEDADAVQELLPQMNGTAMDGSNENRSYDDSCCGDGSSEYGSSEDSSSENGTHAWSTREQMHVKSIEALLRAAQVHADLWKMESVEFWNPTPETVEAARRIHSEAKVVDRAKESISSMRWFGSVEDKAKIE